MILVFLKLYLSVYMVKLDLSKVKEKLFIDGKEKEFLRILKPFPYSNKTR